MNSAQISHLVPLLLLLSATGQGASTPDDGLEIAANTPVASIQPRQANRKFIRLPTLEYTFEIHARCQADREPTSLLLNVADTRKTLDAADFSSGSRVEVTLKIPAAQIGPIAVEDFCHVTNEDVVDNDDIKISAALSAHASLRCESESDQKVIYVSQPLDVNLVCKRPSQMQEDEELIDLD